jgi:hypothetical protein
VDEKFGSGEGDVASAFFTTSFQNRVERCGEAKTDGLLRTAIVISCNCTVRIKSRVRTQILDQRFSCTISGNRRWHTVSRVHNVDGLDVQKAASLYISTWNSGKGNATTFPFIFYKQAISHHDMLIN